MKQKFSDDSAVVGGGFGEWAGRNRLLLNMDKTREMATDIRSKVTASQASSPYAFWGRMMKRWNTDT